MITADIRSASSAITPAARIVFRDGASELTAWLDAKLTEIAAATELTQLERDAARLVIFQDLGRRASRVLAQAVGGE